MNLPDNNVLVNAIRTEASHHKSAKTWLEDALNSGVPLCLFPTVEAGFLRLVTNGKIFSSPTPFEVAWSFLEMLCAAPNVDTVIWTSAARNRWAELCRKLSLSGNDCNDAMLAAVALEKGYRLVTFDRGFKRFPYLPLLLLQD